MGTIVTKIEAAHRQLAIAVKLYFQNDDMVAVHTLACAAREIYEKHCKKQGLDKCNWKMNLKYYTLWSL